MDPKDKRPKDEFLKDEQIICDNIKRRYEFKVNKNEVKAVRIIRYEINNYRSSKPYFTGKIYFEEGGEKEASFFTFKESEGHIARKIFSQASKLSDDGILKPLFVTCYKQKKIYILCYDKFDSLLSGDVTNIVLPVNTGDKIRRLLMTVKYIHGRRLFHGGLKERCNFAIVSGQIKIICVRSLRTRNDLKDRTKSRGNNKYNEDLQKVESVKMKDLTDLRDMLQGVIVEFKIDWEDQDSFFQFFDISPDFWNGYDGFVDHLIKHPSLLSSGKRIKYLFNLEQDIATNKLRKPSLFITKLEDNEFSGYLNWDRQLSRAPRLRNVYQYQGINYNSGKVRDLIRFLANAFVHYRSPNRKRDLDLDIRRVYSDFLNRIHNYV